MKLRYSGFTTLTRQLSVEEPVTEAGDIYRLGCHILARERLVSRPLRLIGLDVSSLGEAVSRQLVLSLKRDEPPNGISPKRRQFLRSPLIATENNVKLSCIELSMFAGHWRDWGN